LPEVYDIMMKIGITENVLKTLGDHRQLLAAAIDACEVHRNVRRSSAAVASAARNSPPCKGKRLRCLRKCRFPYIDTSPALSVRRHLTAAL
jgi:hypothetical protein